MTVTSRAFFSKYINIPLSSLFLSKQNHKPRIFYFHLQFCLMLGDDQNWRHRFGLLNKLTLMSLASWISAGLAILLLRQHFAALITTFRFNFWVSFTYWPTSLLPPCVSTCYCLINATLTCLHALRILAKGVCNHAQCGVGCMLYGTTYNQDSAVYDYSQKSEARESGLDLHLSYSQVSAFGSPHPQGTDVIFEWTLT